MNLKAQALLTAFGHLPAQSRIVEIGTARFETEYASDGFSTIYLAEAARVHGWSLVSVDNEEEACRTAEKLLDERGLVLSAEVCCMDGMRWLVEDKAPISGLYLDGSGSEYECLGQLTAALDRPHRPSVVLIDDSPGPNGVDKGRLALIALHVRGWQLLRIPTEPGWQMLIATDRTGLAHGL